MELNIQYGGSYNHSNCEWSPIWCWRDQHHQSEFQSHGCASFMVAVGKDVKISMVQVK